MTTALDHYPVHSDCDVDCSVCGWYNHEPQGRTWWEHLPDSLDAAWAEAEAALPDGSLLELRRHPGASDDDRYCVTFRASVFADGVTEADGTTPAAALRALAARLRERAA